jgi:alpha-1,3/alpha-1,6-mannosyltransferase
LIRWKSGLRVCVSHLDWENSTEGAGQADVILSNSLFTSKVYSKAFPSLAKRQPKVVYPCIDVSLYQATKKKQSGEGVELIKS